MRPALDAVIQSGPQLLKRPGLMLVIPQRFECLVIRVQRSLKRLHRHGEHVVGEPQATVRRDRCVGDESSSARRAVDQREPFLLAWIGRLDQRPKQMAERENFTRASVSLARHHRQLLASLQQRRNRLDQARADSRMAAQEVRQAGENNAPHHPLGEWLAERHGSEGS